MPDKPWSVPPTRENAFGAPIKRANKDAPWTTYSTPPEGYAWATWDNGSRNVSVWWRPRDAEPLPNGVTGVLIGVKWTRPATIPTFCVLQTQEDRDTLWEWLVTPQETLS